MRGSSSVGIAKSGRMPSGRKMRPSETTSEIAQRYGVSRVVVSGFSRTCGESSP